MSEQLSSLERRMRDWAHCEIDPDKRKRKIKQGLIPCRKCNSALQYHATGHCRTCRVEKCKRCKKPRLMAYDSGPFCGNCKPTVARNTV